MLLERSGGTINGLLQLNKLEDRELPRIIPLSTDNVEVAYIYPRKLVIPNWLKPIRYKKFVGICCLTLTRHFWM